MNGSKALTEQLKSSVNGSVRFAEHHWSLRSCKVFEHIEQVEQNGAEQIRVPFDSFGF